LADARRRRRPAGEFAPAAPATWAGYQARLRAVGWLAEVAGLRGLAVAEAGADVLLRGRLAGWAEAGGRAVVERRLAPADVRTLLGLLGALRRPGAWAPLVAGPGEAAGLPPPSAVDALSDERGPGLS
jgi:hypothetical protein